MFTRILPMTAPLQFDVPSVTIWNTFSTTIFWNEYVSISTVCSDDINLTFNINRLKKCSTTWDFSHASIMAIFSCVAIYHLCQLIQILVDPRIGSNCIESETIFLSTYWEYLFSVFHKKDACSPSHSLQCHSPCQRNKNMHD